MRRSACYPSERDSTWAIRELDFSPDGKLVAFSTDYGIRCWNLETGKHASPILQLGLITNKKDEPVVWKSVQSLAFHPDGNSIFGIGEAHFREWKVATGEFIDKIRPPQAPHYFRLSPDGSKLLAYALESSYKDAASLWNLTTRERLKFDLRFSGHIPEAAFHPKSPWLPPAFPKEGSVDEIRSWLAAFTGLGIGRPEGIADAGTSFLWDQPYALDHEGWSAARARWAPEK